MSSIERATAVLVGIAVACALLIGWAAWTSSRAAARADEAARAEHVSLVRPGARVEHRDHGAGTVTHLLADGVAVVRFDAYLFGEIRLVGVDELFPLDGWTPDPFSRN